MTESRRTRAVVAVLLLGVAALVMLGFGLLREDTHLVGGTGRRAPPLGHASRGPAESESNPVLPKPAQDGAPDGTRLIQSIEQLRLAVPQGAQHEYSASHYGSPGQNVASWISETVIQIGGVDFFATPPYSARVMYGRSDREWLTLVQASFVAATSRAISELSDADRGIAARVAEVRASVRAPYRELIRSIAIDRLRRTPGLMARFDDPRSLAELRTADATATSDARAPWLDALITKVVPDALFSARLSSRDDLRHLSAVDLAEVAPVALAYKEACQKANPNRRTTREQDVEFCRPYAVRLQAIINARLPIDKE